MAGLFGVVYGTNFFIHQPDDRAEKMVSFAADMLAPGGLLSLDRRIGAMADKGPHQHGTDWRGFKRTRADEEAIIRAAGLDLVRYHVTPPHPTLGESIREYAICRRPASD